MNKFSYTYNVKKIDLDTCQIDVEYIPDNILLKPLTLTVWPELDETFGFDLDKAIKKIAPHQKWQMTLYLMDNYNTIVNTSGTVEENE